MENSAKPQSRLNESCALDILLKVSKNLVGTLDLQKILEETVCGVSALFEWGTAAIYLLEGQNHLRLYATYPELPANFPDELRVVNMEEHPHLSQAVRTAQPVFLPDTKHIKLSKGEKKAVEERQLRTLYFVPLVSEENVLGAFIVGSSNQTAIVTDEDAKLTNSLANFAALAIKNARLFAEKYAYTAELEWTIAQRDASEVERKRLQEDLFQVQKLDAIGQLAGGIAHDFNNQLSGILGYAELLLYRLEDEKSVKFASQIVTIAKRSAELNSRLLIFSRKCQLRDIPVDLNQVIDEVVGILRHTISPQIEIFVKRNATDSWTVGDPTQVQSALLNLAVNARDALPEGGILKFETHGSRILDNEMRIGPFLLSPGAYIPITVSDSGVGMSEETIERIFEPFFTTKKEGKGTGMGLAAVFGTMKSHGGAIYVTSCLGKGTTFQLLFPLAHPTQLSGDGLASHAIEKYCPKGGVLVIDDADFNVEVTCTHLNQAGYQAQGYTCPIQAIDFFSASHQAISVVLLDMSMPKRSVSDVFHALRKINPEVSVILMSGFADKRDVQALLDAGACAFLHKPFDHKELLAVCNTLA